jgi:hypothetical protein
MEKLSDYFVLFFRLEEVARVLVVKTKHYLVKMFLLTTYIYRKIDHQFQWFGKVPFQDLMIA